MTCVVGLVIGALAACRPGRDQAGSKAARLPRNFSGTYATETHDDNVEGLKVSEYDTLVFERDGGYTRNHVTVVNGEPHDLDPVTGKFVVDGDLIRLIGAEDALVLRRIAEGRLQPEPGPRMRIQMMRDPELAKQVTEATLHGLIPAYERVP